MRLAPPRESGHYAIVRIARAWYVAATSGELGPRPLSRTVLGVPLVLFRGGDGRAVALLDRCPHRNVPLSLGRLRGGTLECAYHGWRFDGQGRCCAVPGACDLTPDAPARRVPTYLACEQDGYVWVYMDRTGEPEAPPFRFPQAEADATVRGTLEMPATLHATLENILDVPHTALLHRGLFRSGPRAEVEAVVRRGPDFVEAEYLGEPRPPGLAARVLAPRGGRVAHVDRFRLPSIAEVEYRLGPSFFRITQVLTPVEDFRTRIHAVIQFKSPLPAAMVRPALWPLAWRILRQDAAILEAQTRTVRRFGGERFAHTRVDLLGPEIWRLLRQAERREAARPRDETGRDSGAGPGAREAQAARGGAEEAGGQRMAAAQERTAGPVEEVARVRLRI